MVRISHHPDSIGVVVKSDAAAQPREAFRVITCDGTPSGGTDRASHSGQLGRTHPERPRRLPHGIGTSTFPWRGRSYAKTTSIAPGAGCVFMADLVIGVGPSWGRV